MNTINQKIVNDNHKVGRFGLTREESKSKDQSREHFCALVAESWSQMWDEPNEMTFALDQIS